MESLQTVQRKVIETASEKGASKSLKALPLKRYNFTLTKSEFRDRLCIRYNIEAKNTPINYPCVEKFTLSHALQCAMGLYTHMSFNEIRDIFAKIMHGFCYDVEVETTLQLLQGESFVHRTTRTDENARLDFKANGLCGSGLSRYFFDVKIFNPVAKSCPKIA